MSYNYGPQIYLCYILHSPRCNSQVRQRFFSIRVITMWNNLPDDTADFSNLRKFCSSI